jgi:hypothetical protein
LSGLSNLTAFPAGLSVGRDAQGQMQIAVSVKASFTWDRRGTVSAIDAAPLREKDELEGEGLAAGLAAAAEIGPPKPRVDVLLAGELVFRAPITELNVGLSVGNRLRKIVQVLGARVWQSGGGKIAPSRPRAIDRLPISWTRAFGGCDAVDSTFFEPRNPSGSGVVRRPHDLQGKPAPNFEDPRQPIQSSKDRPPPCGFGPVAAHWQPRVKLAGTYDDRWKKDRCPLLPADFDPTFHNVAPADQQLTGYVVGETVRLDGMTVDGVDSFALPALRLPVAFRSRTDMLQTYTRVDTIVIEPAEKRFSIIARAAYVPKPNVLAMRQVVVGALTPGWKRAMATGKLYVDLRALPPPPRAGG